MKSGVVLSEYKKMPDEELVHRFRHRHEHAALTQLFERYGHLVFGLCLSCMKNADKAANATHAIFIKLIADLAKRQDEKLFKPWLYSYVWKYCRDNGFAGQNSSADETAVQFAQGLAVDTSARSAALEKALDTLNTEERKCIELFYLSKMNYKEIATSAGYTIAKVKAVLRNGKRYLKEQLEGIRG